MSSNLYTLWSARRLKPIFKDWNKHLSWNTRSPFQSMTLKPDSTKRLFQNRVKSYAPRHHHPDQPLHQHDWLWCQFFHREFVPTVLRLSVVYMCVSRGKFSRLAEVKLLNPVKFEPYKIFRLLTYHCLIKPPPNNVHRITTGPCIQVGVKLLYFNSYTFKGYYIPPGIGCTPEHHNYTTTF